MFIVGDILLGDYGMEYVIYSVNRATYDVVSRFDVDRGYNLYPSRYPIKKVDCWKPIGHIDLKKTVEPETVAYKKDDILYSSWGYEQTNINFYQVVKSTNKSVWLREIDKIKHERDMSGTCEPIKDSFISEVEMYRIKMLHGKQYVSGSYGTLNMWDGKPKEYTSYA